MKKYLFELVVFIVGSSVMILELAGSRLLSPFVGVSIVVWTSLIGIILGSLSIGYYLGGKAADKDSSKTFLSLTIFTASLFIGSILVIKAPVFALAELIFSNLAARAILTTFLLFCIPNILLGMVTPIIIKLRIDALKTAGEAIGNISMFSTLGSIFGTFVTGLVLLAFFSITQILLGLMILLAGTSLLLSSKFFSYQLLITLFFILVIIIYQFGTENPNLAIHESLYNHIQIYDGIDPKSGKTVKVLNLDNKTDSAMFLENDELVLNYTKFYHLASVINPDLKTVLMIGGGAYSVPKDFLHLYPEITMDVVEIDPELTKIATDQFRLKPNPRLKTYHEDGRTFLNREANTNRKQYDAILLDAFKSFSVPFHLTTKEVAKKMNRLLTKNGVVIVNIISPINGPNGGFLQAEYATYKSIFPNVYLFPVTSHLDGNIVQNVMLVATKGISLPTERQTEYLSNLWTGPIESKPILTDNFAPVDQYVIKNNI